MDIATILQQRILLRATQNRVHQQGCEKNETDVQFFTAVKRIRLIAKQLKIQKIPIEHKDKNVEESKTQFTCSNPSID